MSDLSDPQPSKPENFEDLKARERSQLERYGPEQDADTPQEKLQRNVGRLEGRVDALENTQDQVIRRFEKHLNHINERLDYMSRSWLFGYAAWKLILIGATFIGAILGSIMWGVTEYREWYQLQETNNVQIEEPTQPAEPVVFSWSQ